MTISPPRWRSQRLTFGVHRKERAAQGEAAASDQVRATVIYTTTTGPVKNRHARALADESAEAGVRLVRTKKIPLHGKFVAVDDDEIAVTSLNWASASADPDFPWGEIGVQIHSEGLAASVCRQLEAIFPMLKDRQRR